MNKRQRIRNPKADFTIIPNMYDDADLTVYEFRLLIHYRRVGNCYESTRTTAKKCRMSPTSIIKGRRGLADKGWISLSISEQKTINIVVVDRWSGTPTGGGPVDGHKDVPNMEHVNNDDPPMERIDPNMELDCTPSGTKEVLKELRKNSLRRTEDSSSLSKDPWTQVLDEIGQTYYYRKKHLRTSPWRRYWLKTRYGGQQDGKYIVICETEEQRAWLQDCGKKVAESKLIAVLGIRAEVEFVVEE